MSEVVLGFGKSPRRRSVYVNRSYEGCLWYFWNGGTKEHEPIGSTDLFCLIEEVKIQVGEFKNKPVEKIEVLVQAEAPYRLVAGIDTAFARSLMSSLLFYSFDFAQTVSVVVQSGDEDGVVFGRCYQNGVQASKSAPQLKTIEEVKEAIATINSRLGIELTEAKVPGMEKPTLPPVAVAVSGNSDRIAAMMALTGHAAGQVKAIRHSLYGDTRKIAAYSVIEVDRLRDRLFTDWAAKYQVWKHEAHRCNAYAKLLKSFESAPSDAMLFDVWHGDCEGRSSQAEADDQAECEEQLAGVA